MEYKIRFVNPQKQYQNHRDEFMRTFDEVLSRGDLIMRDDLKNFEQEFAAFCGTKYAIGVNSGTSALDVAFQAVGLGSGDEAITVAHTFVATISCIHMAGAKPVLIDVGHDFNMDAKLIEKAITKRTKAIVPVHLNGRLCDMEAILQIARQKGLIVIEDAAQALGATLTMTNGMLRKAGSFGQVGCFSLYPFKILGGFGNNGMIVTDDEELAHKMRLMRYNGENREDRRFYYHGHNFLMDNLHAALLRIKLRELPKWLTRRRAIADLYHQELSGVTDVTLPHFEDTRFYDVYQNYVIRAKNREGLVKHLTEQGIETLISWSSPMYREPLLLPNDLHLPETEKICQEVVSLPIYPELTDEEIRYVTEAIRQFYVPKRSMPPHLSVSFPRKRESVLKSLDPRLRGDDIVKPL